MGITPAIAVLAIWVAGGLPIEGVRKLPFPQRGDGYNRIHSQVIGSQKELDTLLGELNEEGEGRGKPEAFLKAVTDAKVDFAKEALVLIQNTEGGGPVHVKLWLAEGRDGTFTAMIFRHRPDDDVLLLVSHDCWALVVRRDRVKQITVWRQDDLLKVPQK